MVASELLRILRQWHAALLLIDVFGFEDGKLPAPLEAGQPIGKGDDAGFGDGDFPKPDVGESNFAILAHDNTQSSEQ